MTQGKSVSGTRLLLMMNPSYPWTTKILADRLGIHQNSVRYIVAKLVAKDLIEKYTPVGEITYRLGVKWRLTGKGEKMRKEIRDGKDLLCS